MSSVLTSIPFSTQNTISQESMPTYFLEVTKLQCTTNLIMLSLYSVGAKPRRCGSMIPWSSSSAVITTTYRLKCSKSLVVFPPPELTTPAASLVSTWLYVEEKQPLQQPPQTLLTSTLLILIHLFGTNFKTWTGNASMLRDSTQRAPLVETE